MEGGCIGMCQDRAIYHVEIMREISAGGSFVLVAVLPGKYNIDNVTLPEVTLPLGTLCNADKSSRIKFAIVSRTGVEFYAFITTIDDLQAGRTTISSLSKPNTTIFINDFLIYQKPSFVDYLRAGWAISLVAAIDYTASNGNPSEPRSLHFLGK
jgi:hypothetical protein